MIESYEEQNLLKGYLMMLYFSGTMVMFDPSRECVYDFWTKGILKQLPVSSNNPNFIKAAALLRESSEKSDRKFELLSEDYTRLFTGTGIPLAPPYESVYRDGDRLIFGKTTADVTGFYRKHNWESRFRDKIPDDHLGTELLFLAYLIEEYLAALTMQKKAVMANAALSFIREHLLSWLHSWSSDTKKHAKTIGYKGIAMLVLASVEDICKIIEDGITTRTIVK